MTWSLMSFLILLLSILALNIFSLLSLSIVSITRWDLVVLLFLLGLDTSLAKLPFWLLLTTIWSLYLLILRLQLHLLLVCKLGWLHWHLGKLRFMLGRLFFSSISLVLVSLSMQTILARITIPMIRLSSFSGIGRDELSWAWNALMVLHTSWKLIWFKGTTRLLVLNTRLYVWVVLICISGTVLRIST